MIPATFSAILNDCDSTKNWSVGGDSSNYSINTTGQYQGSACINWEINPALSAGNSAFIQNPYIGTKDISLFNEVRFNFFLGDATLSAISSAEARVGTDSSNFSYWTLTQAQLSALANPINGDWREIILTNLTGASSTGTVDQTDINYLYFNVVHNGSLSASLGTIRLDNWRAIKNFNFESDIELDGVGYMLKRDSYVREDLPYTVDRFSTGDITYSDFDIYQYHAQTDWSGGWNEEFDVEENVYYDAQGLDSSIFGEIKNNWNGKTVGTVAVSGRVSGFQEYRGSAFIAVDAGDNSARVYSWPGTGTTLTLQRTINSPSAVDMIVFQNDLWVSSGDALQLQNFDGATWSAIAQSGTYFSQLGDELFMFDNGGNLRSSDGATWATEYTQTGWVPHRAVTWNGKIYYMAGTIGAIYTDQTKCALFSYDGQDRLTIAEFDSWCLNSISLFNNKIWFVVGGILKSYDGEKIIDELDISNRYPKPFGIDNYAPTIWYHGSGRGLLSIEDKFYAIQNSASGNSGEITSQILINPGLGFTPYYYGGTNLTALGSYNINNERHLIYGTNIGQVGYIPLKNDTSITAGSGYLESSWFDANLFSIDKLFKSIQLFYKPFPEYTDQVVVDVQYKVDNNDNAWTTIGRLTSTSGSSGSDGVDDGGSTFMEFDLPAQTYGKKIKYKIVWTSTNSTHQVTFTDIAIKYIIVPDTKRKWNFDLVLSNNLLKNNNIRDTDDGNTKAIDIWASRIKKENLLFKDIDNQIYSVVVNDLKLAGPTVQTGRDSDGTGPEYIASIELLEG